MTAKDPDQAGRTGQASGVTRGTRVPSQAARKHAAATQPMNGAKIASTPHYVAAHPASSVGTANAPYAST